MGESHRYSNKQFITGPIRQRQCLTQLNEPTQIPDRQPSV